MKYQTILWVVAFTLLLSCNNKHPEGTTILLSNTNNKASCIRFSGDEKNHPLVSWCETSKEKRKYFFFSFFDEKTKTFSKKIHVPIEQNARFHEEGMPKIAVKKDGAIIAVYETSAPTEANERAGYLRYVQSFDRGKTWTQPLYVHADTTPGKGHSFADITRLGDGEIGVCWLDVSFDAAKGGRPVKFAKSNGRSGFSGEQVIDSLACECCRTAIGSDGQRNVAIVFRDIIQDSIRDIAISTSNNNGETFSSAVSFSGDQWMINGCPHNGPSITIEDKTIFTGWFTGGREKGVYYAVLNDKKETITKQLISSSARNIQLCLLPGGDRLIAFNESIREGDSVFSKILVNRVKDDEFYEADVSSARGHGGYPVIYPAGENYAVVGWAEKDKVYYKLVNAAAIIKRRQTPHIAKSSRSQSPIKLAFANDPVCRMPIRNAGDTTLYKGNIIGFCSESCKEQFMQDPESY